MLVTRRNGSDISWAQGWGCFDSFVCSSAWTWDGERWKVASATCLICLALARKVQMISVTWGVLLVCGTRHLVGTSGQVCWWTGVIVRLASLAHKSYIFSHYWRSLALSCEWQTSLVFCGHKTRVRLQWFSESVPKCTKILGCWLESGQAFWFRSGVVVVIQQVALPYFFPCNCLHDSWKINMSKKVSPAVLLGPFWSSPECSLF